MAKHFNFAIGVSTNNLALDESRVRSILGKLIDSGLANAQSTLDEGDGDQAYAEMATDLNIATPIAFKAPRVLVTVEGGCAQFVADDGVDCIVYDIDNHKHYPEEMDGVPERFADLAAPLNIPIEGREQAITIEPKYKSMAVKMFLAVPINQCKDPADIFDEIMGSDDTELQPVLDRNKVHVLQPFDGMKLSVLASVIKDTAKTVQTTANA